MPRSITETEDAILQGRLKVLQNPVLTYCSASAVLEQDASGNKKWSKRKSLGRIDGIVALSMAIGCAMSEGEPEPAGVFVFGEAPEAPDDVAPEETWW
jgi:phage terminase large subunit-like protein